LAKNGLDAEKVSHFCHFCLLSRWKTLRLYWEHRRTPTPFSFSKTWWRLATFTRFH